MKRALHSTATQVPHPWIHVWASVRWEEVLVLQGTPLMGALLASGHMHASVLTPHWWLHIALLVLGNLCLVAHVFVLNDWAEITADLQDPLRSQRTFANKGVRRAAVGWLAVILLISSLLIFAALGVQAFVLAVLITGASVMYSVPPFHMKGRPVSGTALHLVSGSLHFLLGYAALAPVGSDGILVSVFFGLVFAAGHLNHEVRGYAGDTLNHIRTNAVAFGRVPCFLAAFVLFSLGYVLLEILVWQNRLPQALCIAAFLYPIHCAFTWRALREELSLASLIRLQKCYRALYALVGAVIALALLLHQI
ncbi:UbiA family prenyltransferase [Diaphorobacter sp. HDW4B]|uniref:UbiA family prenyltransferase n=1 Tax=Diaphorobacter sp. HDW4B TaxID=2714925 RepID=UPI00140BD7C2|nr:UbiA family prenyltransferase [Diaphorobacter sp. HDW4B]QIL72489.1 UbiA family prenyltransferase [Diaphorobacter sp. HDW4B]